jgi:hypothetical protein
MTTVFTSERSRSIPFITGGAMERIFSDSPASLCPARLAFHKANRDTAPDNGAALARGIVAGAVVERELIQWATGKGLTADLIAAIEATLTTLNVARRLPADELRAVVRDVHRLVRNWQEGFPPDDDGLPWEDL